MILGPAHTNNLKVFQQPSVTAAEDQNLGSAVQSELSHPRLCTGTVHRSLSLRLAGRPTTSLAGGALGVWAFTKL